MKNKQPLVSIITPSYNQGNYIEQTLRSVLFQDYPNIEYIVIDGGSTDNSVSVIEQYQDRLAFFVSEKDNGQSDAINKGFQRAKGDIVAWLNSDDVYTEHAVSRAVAALAKCPGCGFVFGNVLSIDMQSNVFNTMTFGDWGLHDLMRFKIISQPGLFMHKQALDDVGFLNPDFHYLMDHHLWLKIASRYPVQYIDEFWAAARYHPEAKNLTGGAHYGKEAFKLYEWMLSHPKLADISRQNQRKIESGAYHLQAHYLLDSGQNWKALMSYLNAAIRDGSIFLSDYQRMGFALLNSIFSVDQMRKSYLEKRSREIQSQNYERFLKYINKN